MNKLLIRIMDWRWQRAARTIVFTAALVMILGAGPAAAAKTCKKSIKACGCVVKKGQISLANDLTSSSAGADCVTIAGAHVTLDMAGHQITGPGGGATGAGIHVMSSGNGAFIDGVNHKITGFGTGILVDASDVAIAFISLRSNAQFGLKINGGSRNSLYNSGCGRRIHSVERQRDRWRADQQRQRQPHRRHLRGSQREVRHRDHRWVEQRSA